MLNNQHFTCNRTNYIGGSDIAAILGLSPYRTPLEVWLEKTGQATQRKDSLPLRFGQYAEEFVAQEYAKSTGQIVIEHPEAFTYLDHPYLVGHIDRFVLLNEKPLFNQQEKLVATKLLECKTANPFTQAQWGEAGSDEVPMPYLVQCLWYLMLTGCETADLAVLFSNADFRIYTIKKDREVEALLLDKALNFWQEHVQKNIPPPLQNEQDCRILFNQAKPGKRIEADKKTLAILDSLHTVNCELQIYEEKANELKQSLMQTMQDAEELTFQGKPLVSWKTPKPSKKIDTKRLGLEMPDLAAKYQIEIANSRRFVLKGLPSHLTQEQ